MSYINSEKLSNSEKAEVEACVANGLVLNTIFGDFKDESVKTSFINKGDKFYLTFYITKKASVAEKLMKKALSILKGRESSIANISVDAIRDMDEITIKGVSELLVDQNDKTTVIEQDAEKILEAVKFETVLTGETLKLFHESILIMKSEILLLKNKQLVTETASILQDQKDILKNITLNISSSLKELYSNEKSLTFEDVESHLKLLKIARAEFITILNFLSLISFIFNAAENDKLIEEIGLEKSAQRKFLSEALISKLKMHLENSKEF